MVRTILHVDMDAFYAAVEQRDHPEYRGKPVVVGSDPKNGKGRGIVATCSYEARKFGVHSAQPISQAWKLCPHGIYVRPDMQKYARVSARIMRILAGFTDLLEQVSIDEAFLDVSGSRRLFGTGTEIAVKIKYRIYNDLSLTASVGVAQNKFIAKIASDLQKPDGLVVVETGREKEFLAPLAIGRLWGVGPKTEAYLKSLGVERIGQLADLPPGNSVSRMGKAGMHLLRLARGIDDRPVLPEEGFKSIGHEITFDSDTTDPELLKKTLLELTERVAQRLRKNKACARTVAIKFRESDFSTSSRRTTLDSPADTVEVIFPVAVKLMKSLLRHDVPVRLIGVHTGNLELEEDGKQMSFFDRAPRKDRKLAAAMDDIVQRFGGNAITRAALVSPKKPPQNK
ncbi:MAG: DNA polymerase IV [Acidobacteria bacterium]|nr:DNA polymerase IV [Acidobacteriota bacterium]